MYDQLRDVLDNEDLKTAARVRMCQEILDTRDDDFDDPDDDDDDDDDEEEDE